MYGYDAVDAYSWPSCFGLGQFIPGIDGQQGGCEPGDYTNPGIIDNPGLGVIDNPGGIDDPVEGIARLNAPAARVRFIRADANADGAVNLSDGIFILLSLFGGGAVDCEEAADTNANGVIDLSDAVLVFAYLYQGGEPPPAPFPGCGVGTTSADSGDDGGGLACERFAVCPAHTSP